MLQRWREHAIGPYGEQFRRFPGEPVSLKKFHHKVEILRLSIYLSHSAAVADPEGVQWVPWNPTFKGLPSKISVCANVLHTLRSH